MTMLSARIPFAGFYGSLWDDALDRESDSLIEHIAEEPYRYSPAVAIAAKRGLIGEIVWEASDFSAMKALIVRDYVAAFADWLAGSLRLPAVTVEFEEMVSPRYYNFETDRLFAKLDVSVFRLILARLDGEWPSAFDDAVRAHFTSRDGFASFYDNDPDALRAKPLEEWDHNELYVLLSAWVDANTDGESIDWLLYEDVEAYRAFDVGLDWDKIETLAKAAVADLDDLDGSEIDLLERPARCPYTLELPL